MTATKEPTICRLTRPSRRIVAICAVVALCRIGVRRRRRRGLLAGRRRRHDVARRQRDLRRPTLPPPRRLPPGRRPRLPPRQSRAASPIKIGLLAAITGASSTGQRNVDKVAAAWETWVNENGGVAGQPVEVVFKDSANDAAKTQAAAKELVEQEEVIAVVLADGTTEDAVGPYLNEQRMPVVGGFGFSSNVWGKLDNFFTLKTDVTAIVAGPILAADVVGATTFGAVVCSENPSCAQAEQLYQSLIPSIGIDYAGLATAGFAGAELHRPVPGADGQGRRLHPDQPDLRRRDPADHGLRPPGLHRHVRPGGWHGARLGDGRHPGGGQGLRRHRRVPVVDRGRTGGGLPCRHGCGRTDG